MVCSWYFVVAVVCFDILSKMTTIDQFPETACTGLVKIKKENGNLET